MKNSGKSKSIKFPNGARRKVDGKELAPRSLRKKGKKFLSDCSDKELDKAKIIRHEEKKEDR